MNLTDEYHVHLLDKDVRGELLGHVKGAPRSVAELF